MTYRRYKTPRISYAFIVAEPQSNFTDAYMVLTNQKHA